MNEENVALMTERLKECLEEAESYEPSSTERKALMQEASMLADKLTELEKVNFEYFDKEERRKIEQMRNETTAEIEREKMTVKGSRMALEVLKIAIVPVALLGMQIKWYMKAQDNVMHLEEHGTVKSNAGRQHSLPKFWK